jgi:exodeoxyribonuclease X
MSNTSGVRIRVLDLETTGRDPKDQVVEIAAVDIIGDDIVIVGSDLINPTIPIPAQASAVHHITDNDVAQCMRFEHHVHRYLDISGKDRVYAFASHNWRFDGQWVGDYLDGRPAICTYKCALRMWPDAPAHNNQTLRYWLSPKGLNSLVASCAHRALPDAYVTAFILREMLAVASVEELVTWTSEPVLLPRVTFGKYRGQEWTDLPLDYLTWVAEKSELSDDVKFTADFHRRQRSVHTSYSTPRGTGEFSISP